ncbi:ubiquinone biosynthesis regulatory protein kinase UbiB [Catenovulum sp. SM1970]|uniref:ubiquinone biosynthesis regulatory protein kinase UbiB n=1 Tax=Marinifaba aquimaris TaxID=2741323 RepID=UPI00157389B0|nr:ubiquinone biosynthesis regulatory protein kinase UbiB [Marinifaba aquimaris]NTS77454.1 ubiquinone biosynthesis regulatory protein kinase UbiB [Marinifaba aquimaris]
MRFFRLYTIVKTLLIFGLDDLIPDKFKPWYFNILRASIFWLRNRHKDKSHGERLRLALQSLGPVFIKFGQMLSTRRDLMPDDVANELAILQDQVKAFDGEQAKAIIEQAWQVDDISEVVDDFDMQPLASASIAQVHTAKIAATEHFPHSEIVIKVIRPDIAKVIRSDIDLMHVLASIVAKFLADGKRLRPVEVVREYEKTLFDELNLLRESANTLQLKRNFEGSDSLYIPDVHSDLCRENVLVMERIYGIPCANVAELEAQGTDMKLLAERGVEIFFTQVFRDSFFHADMHPGNIFVSRENPDNPMYIGIDCGIVGTLNKEDKRYLADNFIAFFNRDYRKVAELHVDSGWVPSHINIEEFEFAIRTVCEPIFNKPLAEISFGHVLMNLFNTARRFEMEVQPQLVLLQKTLLYIEGLGRQLYPQLDLWTTAKPFLENWLKDQIGPKAIWRNIKENAPFWGEKLPELPDLIYKSLKQQQNHQAQLNQLLEQKQAKQTSLFSQIGHVAAISAAIIYGLQSDLLVSSGLVCVAIIAWVVGHKL